MRIGFDAKRVFQNNTGLGNYSRTLISSLAENFPEHNYFLFAPKLTDRFIIESFSNIQNVVPDRFPFTILKSAWRSSGVKKDLLHNGIQLYHGLSHEIPIGINKTNIRSVVTIHDLIFERYQHQHNKTDVLIYRKKFRHACKYADAIIAISQQTKKDIVNFYGIPEEKITVCYQACNPTFNARVTNSEKEKIRLLYNLPLRYFLSVGSIIERKNLLTICKAIKLLRDTISCPLVVIGTGKKYRQKVQAYIIQNNLQDKIIFLSENSKARTNPGFRSSDHFPAIYQMAEALIYPSIFEGFGIPVLEALVSKIPVITSNISSLPEAGGDAAIYIDPYDHETLCEKMKAILADKNLVNTLTEKGLEHAQNYSTQSTSAAVMKVYQKLLF